MPEEKRRNKKAKKSAGNFDVGFPTSSRILLNELFSRYPTTGEWMYRFPDLDDVEEGDDNDNEEDEKEEINLRKSDMDIKMSVKAIICQDYNADGDERFLILKDEGTDWWDLPGGHLEDGETSDEALMREVNEETGLECDGHEEIFTKWMKLGDEEKAVMFFFSDASGDVELSEEHTDYAWITIDEINDYNLGVFSDVIEEAFQDYK